MPLPHLHIIHPSVSRFPAIKGWVSEAVAYCNQLPEWGGCAFRVWECDSQAGIHVPTVSDYVRRNRGPVIAIEKVQHRMLESLRSNLGRRIPVYEVSATGPDSILGAMEQARIAFERGEPLMSAREVTAFLIVRKLYRQDKWGGESLNKNYLWSSDIPKGGFPRELLDKQRIMNAVEVLFNAEILVRKWSERQWKYGLKDKGVVEAIIRDKTFGPDLRLQRYFGGTPDLVPHSYLDFNEDT